jgi:hypothetical protein
MHITSKLTYEDAINVLKDSNLFTELSDIRSEGTYGCRLTGVTISNKDLLQTIIQDNLIPDIEVLQVPGWLVRQQPELAAHWKQRRPQNRVFVNSCVRHRPDGMSVEDAYKTCIVPAFVDVVLCGSRNHLAESINIVKSLK